MESAFLDYASQVAAEAKADNLAKIKAKIDTAQTYQSDYMTLEARQKELQLVSKLMKKHKQKRSANKAMQEVRDRARNKADIKQWLKDLKNWSTKSYELITGLRRLVTGQTIVYHILDSNKTTVFEVSEDEFLNLIAQQDLDFGGRGGWNAINKALSGPNPANLADLFELRVNTTEKADRKNNKTGLQVWQEKNAKNATVRDIKGDVLYNYIASKYGDYDDLQTPKGTASHAAIFELYDQLYHKFEWEKTSAYKIVTFQGANTTDGFSNYRKDEVDVFMDKYMQDIKPNKSDTFYEAGDVTASEDILVENKMRGATVSIKTIKDAIDKIASLDLSSVAQLKEGLKKIFVKQGTGFIAEVRKEAYEKAIKAIDDFI